MTGTPQGAWHDAYNETDAALARVEGLGVALEELVEAHLNTGDSRHHAITTLVKTLNEKLLAALELRSAEFRAGLDATKAAAA